MRELLFDGIHEVSEEEVIEIMNHFKNVAEKGMEVSQTDPAACLEIAKRLRSELEKEYKNNSLRRIRELYKDSRFLESHYQPAVHHAVASILGKTSRKNMYSFLYDVRSYMNYYTPHS